MSTLHAVAAEGPQATVTPNLLALPAEMRERVQWAVSGADKAPMVWDGNKLRLTKVTTPADWMTFDKAFQVMADHAEHVTHHVTGEGVAVSQTGLKLGYMLQASDPFTCIDMDVKNADTHPGKPEKWSTAADFERYQSIMDTFDSYTERSRSGLGLHVWLKGNIGKGKRADVEIYSQERFIICTGDVIRAVPIADGGEALSNMLSLMGKHTAEPIDLVGDDTPDWSVVALAQEDTSLLGRLFRGEPETVSRYQSASEADLALCKLLYRRVGSPLECWRTFQESKLGQRVKDGKVKSRRAEYAKRTMAIVMQHHRCDADALEHGVELADAIMQHYVRRGPYNAEATGASEEGETSEPGETGFHAKIPKNLLSGAVAPMIDLANVPGPVADFASACASAYGFDQSGLAMAAITAVAAMMSDGYQLEVMSRWYVSARLWTVLIGKSASGKSPVLKMATAPVKAQHNSMSTDYDTSLIFREKDDGPPPPRPALYTSDSTIEALSERLSHNSRGMLMLTEEFSSWIGGIDSSSKGDGAKNRGNWLQLYDGGPYQIDRIIRGSILIENWGASILTASTPSGLADQMKHLPEDGLIQRFIPVIIGPMNHSADGDAGEAQDRWKEGLDRIYMFTSQPKVVQLSPEARQLFKATKADLGQTAAAIDSISSGLASHVSKHTEMVARIALIFHAIEARTSDILAAATLQKAINLMSQLRRHSVALFTDILGASPSTEIARALARSLAAADPEKTQTIGRDWMTQHCRAFEKAKDDRVRRDAVQLLEDLDWLLATGTRVYAGWPTKFEVNRSIFRLYAREGEAHRQKRAAVKAVFGDDAGIED